MKKLFVDDLRQVPDDTWTVARTPWTALHLLSTVDFDVVSLDHDLGGYVGNKELTGYDVLKWMIERKVTESGYVPPKVLVHSANVVEASKIMSDIEMYWNNIKVG